MVLKIKVSANGNAVYWEGAGFPQELIATFNGGEMNGVTLANELEGRDWKLINAVPIGGNTTELWFRKD